MASLALVWDLIARDAASPAFTRVGAAAEGAAAKADAATAAMERSSAAMATVGKVAKVATAAGVVFAGVSLKMAADFQSATTRLVTSANESQGNLKMVQQGLLDMAGQVGYSTDELAAAMYKVESGGQHGAAALETLKAAAQGAKTENADLTTVADALTSVLTDYHLKASDSADVTSKLVAATASGKMTFEELSGSLAAVLPVASANHVALNDILGDLASMTMHGMSAEQASQNLADTIRHLAAPTQQQQKQFAALGLTTQQVTADLGEKGLSGTIGVITDAIKKQMGSDTERVVLDLNTALEKLPASVRDLGQGVLDGTLSLGDWRKAVKALPAEQAIAAQSFMALVGSTHQIGNETKDGAEIYQSYSGALRQALGDATGMNVALMIGGENAGNTATAIANVSGATAEAGGNVKGWAEIQSTFNQQLSEFVHSLEAATIKVGERLLPAMTTAFGWLNDHALPALRDFAGTVAGFAHTEGFQSFLSGAQLALHTLWDTLQGIVRTLGPVVEGVGHLFASLPGPVQAVTLAVAGFALAVKTGLLSGIPAAGAAVEAAFVRMGAAVTAPVVAIQGLSDEMALQQRLMQMEAESADLATTGLSGMAGAFSNVAVASTRLTGGLSAAQLAMAGLDAELAATVVEEEAAVVSTGNLGTAMSILAQRGVAGAAAGLKGLMGMLGGPMGLAMIGVTVGVMGLEAAIRKADETEQSWTEALKQGGKAADEATGEMAKAQAKLDALNNSWQGATLSGKGFMGFLGDFVPGMGAAQTVVRDGTANAQDAKKAYDDWYKSLTGVDKAQQDVKTATADLNAAVDKYGPSSLQANEAAQALAIKQGILTGKTTDATNAARTHIQALQDEANQALAAANSSLASEQANLSFTTQLKSYEDQLKAGTLAGDAQTSALISLTQQAISAASAAGQLAADQAKANGITDDGTLANKAILKSLQDSAAQFTANGQAVPAEIQKQIDALTKATDNTNIWNARAQDLGLTIIGLPNDHYTEIKVPTDDQVKALQGLGQMVITLPDGKVVVTSNTQPAIDDIKKLLNQQYKITVGIGAQGQVYYDPQQTHFTNKATGGFITGPGTGTSDSIPARLSNGEYVVKARSVSKYGVGMMNALNEGRFADGGLVGPRYELNIPTVIPASVMSSASVGIGKAINSAAQSLFSVSPGPGSGAARWAGTILRVLSELGVSAGALNGVENIIQHESGGNPNAINLTDSNAKAGHPSQGLMQTIPSTFAAYAGPYRGLGITSPLASIYAGVNYALHRYGAAWLARGGNTGKLGGYAGYATGTDFVPETGLALLHKGEKVVPVAQNQGAPYTGGGDVHVHVYDTDGVLLGTMRGEARKVTDGRLEDMYRQKAYR